MKQRPLSASSVKSFLQCNLQYYFRYEDKKPSAGRANHLALGTALHAGLEVMHREVAAIGGKPTREIYDQVLETYYTSAAKDGLNSMASLDEGRDILIARLDTVDPEEKIIGLELGFDLVTPAGTPFTGHIDKLIELDPTTAAIVDYKSSRMALTQEEADEDIQLSMYDLAVSILYPQYTTIVSAFDYLRMNEVLTDRTPEQRVVFTQFLDAIYKSIIAMEEADVKPSLNTFCGWCDYKSYCPAFKAIIDDPKHILPRPDGLDDDQFISEWVKVEAARKIVDTYYREMKEEAYRRMAYKESIKGQEQELYKTQNGRKSYDTYGIYNVVGPERFLEMAYVGPKGVEKFVRDNPKHAEAVEHAAVYSFQSPSFRTRKVQKPATQKIRAGKEKI